MKLQDYQALILSGGTRRIHRLGVREIAGVLVPQGAVVEEWDSDLKVWRYVDQVHPDDATQVASIPSRFAK